MVTVYLLLMYLGGGSILQATPLHKVIQMPGIFHLVSTSIIP